MTIARRTAPNANPATLALSHQGLFRNRNLIVAYLLPCTLRRGQNAHKIVMARQSDDCLSVARLAQFPSTRILPV